MKKQITIALLLIVSAFAACKKDEGPQVDIAGTWKVAKFETQVGIIDPVVYIGTASDNIEFRRNEENEMVVNLEGVSSIGHYVILEHNGIRFSYKGENRVGQITKLTANELEITATVETSAAAPKTEKYYLNR